MLGINDLKINNHTNFITLFFISGNHLELPPIFMIDKVTWPCPAKGLLFILTMLMYVMYNCGKLPFTYYLFYLLHNFQVAHHRSSQTGVACFASLSWLV